MELLTKFIENVFLLANAMSLFILLGLLLAGALKQLVPSDFVSKHLGESKTGAVVKATLFGIPLPVCSCSVIPLAKSLQQEGASKGAVQSFLISTPITGVDSIMATYGFFGWIFTLYRVVTSVVIAITTGILQNMIGEKGEEPAVKKPGFSLQTVHKPMMTGLPPANNPTSFGLTPAPAAAAASEEGCSGGSCCEGTAEKRQGFSVTAVFRYAFVTLFRDIYFSLFLGILLGALFTTILPKELLASLFAYKFLTYFLVLLIAMPLYVCATASLPIAAAFLLSGMSGGAAFVFLSAGPATNTVTMGVVASMFGKRSLLLYLGVISSMSILFGYFYDLYFDKLEVLNVLDRAETFGAIDYASTAVMFGLIAYYLLRRK